MRRGRVTFHVKRLKYSSKTIIDTADFKISGKSSTFASNKKRPDLNASGTEHKECQSSKK